MNKVIAICGKVASGKTYYAMMIKEDMNAVLLSNDEVLKHLFPGTHPNDDPKLMERINAYLLTKAEEITENGCDVILDWGFWTKKERRALTDRFDGRHIPIEWIYLDIDEKTWKEHIKQRNLNNNLNDYDYQLPEQVIKKANDLFEIPDKAEIDIWIKD